MLNKEQKKQFNTILEELGQALDISKTEHEAAVESYNAVAKHLTRPGSSLEPYKPDIVPQGSFMIGTTIKPVVDGDDIDIDLVCQLTGKQIDWTQLNLKQVVGDELKENKIYLRLLKKDGRRCWTLRYRENAKGDESKYHMDILPSVVDQNYQLLYESTFSKKGLGELDVHQLDELAIRITDRKRDDYESETDHLKWLKSNPFGYAKWFENRTIVRQLGATKEPQPLLEWIQPVPTWKEDKQPLQRVVQILKRHRDIFYTEREDKDDKPISIIITTLAAKAYQGEADIREALQNVVPKMLEYITEEYDYDEMRMVKRIENPVNPLENFADKWIEHPQREKNFFEWHNSLKADLDRFFAQQGLGGLNESLSPFGSRIAEKVATAMGDRMRQKRERGDSKILGSTGLLGDYGDKISNHNFHAEDE